MNYNPHGINKGKVVYWIEGHRFENSKDKRDGKQRAVDYCLANFLNPNDIQKFDSRTECNRYEYLLSLKSAGKIKNLSHHQQILVMQEYTNANGDTIPALTYEADFIYDEVEPKRKIVEDVKGSEYFLDERFITIKQVFDRVMLKNELYIRVILFRNNDWVEWHIGDAKKQGKLIKKQREEIKNLRKEKHDREVEERKLEREKARYIELTGMVVAGKKLTSAQKKRLAELEPKFGKVIEWQ